MTMTIVLENFAISRAPIRNHAWMATVTKRFFQWACRLRRVGVSPASGILDAGK
jgi:hypothetical protein